ncbi:TMEM175 family protein [Actinosynnema sp. NPDC020468]|uniref:TMEM175 family protein n=1 Tax=Actinosynnema sp. NPDC020468 TaxID=3154488 RepID=UPI0033C33D4E
MGADGKSPERLVFFTDAVVAIALTLLVLPLTEVVGEVVREHGRSVEVVTGNRWQIYSFLLSFAVIARLWVVHHRLFESIKSYSEGLVLANFCWLLSVVVLPFPTEMVGGFDTDRFTALFYIGTILAGALSQTAMLFIARGNPDLTREPISDQRVANAVGTVLVLVVAMALGALRPDLGYFGLFLLFVPPLVARRWSDA